MKHKLNMMIFGLALVSAISSFTWAKERQKLAQTGFQFLSVMSDARAAGMGGAVNSVEMGSSSLFSNPACMATMPNRIDITFSQNQWIADINHTMASVAINPSPKSPQYGVIGFSFQSVDYGNFVGTIVAPGTEKGFELTDIFSPTAFAAGVGYAKSLSDRFSVGGQIRWVYQNLRESRVILRGDTVKVKNEMQPFSFDFGTLFKTGIKSLQFGMSIRHFSKELKYAYEGFQLPLLFTMGVSMNVMDLLPEFSSNHRLIVSIDATHDRSYPEQLLIGLDYTFMRLLSLRAGYITNDDEEGLSFGLGISTLGLQLDYAYTPYGVFDKVQRMTARFSF